MVKKKLNLRNYDKEGNTQIHLGSQVTTTTVATTIESTVATTEPSEAKGFITLYTSVRKNKINGPPSHLGDRRAAWRGQPDV